MSRTEYHPILKEEYNHIKETVERRSGQKRSEYIVVDIVKVKDDMVIVIEGKYVEHESFYRTGATIPGIVLVSSTYRKEYYRWTIDELIITEVYNRDFFYGGFKGILKLFQDIHMDEIFRLGVEDIKNRTLEKVKSEPVIEDVMDDFPDSLKNIKA